MTPSPLLASHGGPVAQLRTGRLPRRIVQLAAGLLLYGFTVGLIVRSALGLSPWDVLHAGVQRHLGVSFGMVVIGVGIAVLLAWIPLRQQPGVGTVANVVMVGLSVDATCALVDQPDGLGARMAFLTVGIVLNALAGALYLGSQLGPSARDGLMTGLARRTGCSLRLVRTCVEVSALIIGFLLGGPVALGTLTYALAIGPLVQMFLRLCVVRLPEAP